MPKRVVIVGGGLAGMAAAVALHSAGANVTLVEARKSLGGRAGSFEDPQSGETLDNCQHVLLGCCTNLLDFYQRIGALNRIQWTSSIHFIDAHANRHALWSMNKIPAPFHLAVASVLFSALSFTERSALARAMLAMLRLGTRRRAELADVSFGDWLAQHQQPDSLIDKFYDLVLVSALNEQCRRASAAYAIQVFQESLLVNSAAYRMGTPAVPLAKLYEKIPCPDIRLATRINSVKFSGSRAVGVELPGQTLDADAVVLAVNFPTLEKWLPEELTGADERFANLDKLETVPILGAHFWFDRPILDTPHAALMSGPLQWLFAKPGHGGKALHGVISAARHWAGRPRSECLPIFHEQIRQIFPAARDAKLERGVVVVEKRATFSPLPGVDRFRPTQAPPPNGIANLFLAGDYTRTGWPATMEGAVRSGYLAAEAVLQSPGKFLLPDLPQQWPARLLS
jgi:zeta-carotene desaturase